MKRLLRLIVLSIILFFGYITILSSYNTNAICLTQQTVKEIDTEFYFDEEPYIDDIPFNTKVIYDSLMRI